MVSVIMNCCNCERYLREAIDSVFAQTFTSWEIVFWDNASHDSSGAVAKSYGERVRYFRSDEKHPLGKARNLAMAQAGGRYMALLDCDDVWLPRKLECQVAVAERNPEIGLVYADAFFISADGTERGTFFQRVLPSAGQVAMKFLTGANFVPCVTAMFPARVLSEVGGLNESLTFVEEYELFLRIAKRFSVAYVAEPLAKYRLHGGNLTGMGSSGTTVEMIHIIENFVRANRPPALRDRLAVSLRVAKLYGKLALQCARTGEWRRLREAVLKRPPAVTV
jgi:glycosyltransferase involved in cell wall biosynthesis